MKYLCTHQTPANRPRSWRKSVYEWVGLFYRGKRFPRHRRQNTVIMSSPTPTCRTGIVAQISKDNGASGHGKRRPSALGSVSWHGCHWRKQQNVAIHREAKDREQLARALRQGLHYQDSKGSAAPEPSSQVRRIHLDVAQNGSCVGHVESLSSMPISPLFQHHVLRSLSGHCEMEIPHSV